MKYLDFDLNKDEGLGCMTDETLWQKTRGDADLNTQKDNGEQVETIRYQGRCQTAQQTWTDPDVPERARLGCDDVQSQLVVRTDKYVQESPVGS